MDKQTLYKLTCNDDFDSSVDARSEPVVSDAAIQPNVATCSARDPQPRRRFGAGNLRLGSDHLHFRVGDVIPRDQAADVEWIRFDDALERHRR